MRTYSKSKLLSLRQCPRRLWLELHHPELQQDSEATKALFRTGNEVGTIARQLYDQDGQGTLIDASDGNLAAAQARTAELLLQPHPIFEAAFSADGARALADVLLPETANGQTVWHMVEVKSSTSVKDYHRDDVAIQAHVAKAAGLPLRSIRLAHIDSDWTYPGNGDYRGLLREVDLTTDAFARSGEVRSWIEEARRVDALPTEPDVATGLHCQSPYDCGFRAHCSAQEPQAEYPVAWLPRLSIGRQMALRERGVLDMRDIPDEDLNAIQRRVRDHTVANTTYFDAKAAAAALAPHGFPAYFLDFETIQFGVPVWVGTRPYQQIPFQFSLHILDGQGQLTQKEFLDLSGNDPSQAFALALVQSCGDQGPIYVYNAAFEKTRIADLAARFPALSEGLMRLNLRVIDLLPVAREHYYHPNQQGSWSIKKLLPAIVADLAYDALDGVQDGGMAMEAFMEAIAPTTDTSRKEQIDRQLRAYCRLDTYAMVRLWQVFAGRTDLQL